MSDPTQQHRDEARALLHAALVSLGIIDSAETVPAPEVETLAHALARRDATTLSEGRAMGRADAIRAVVVAREDRLTIDERLGVAGGALILAVNAIRALGASPQAGTADRYQEGLVRAVEVADGYVDRYEFEVRACRKGSELWHMKSGQHEGAKEVLAAIRAELPADAPPREKGQP